MKAGIARWIGTGRGLALAGAMMLGAASAQAQAATDIGAYLLFDAGTGEVLAQDHAFQAWYPASVTKLMTTYVTLNAIKSGRIRLTSPVTMTAFAANQPPSKMGFPVGTIITVDNALKIIMVKSANDVAWALAESVGGTREAFIAEMNATAARLGMTGTRYANANGLPDDNQVTNAHDLAVLARALLRDHPQQNWLYSIGALQLGKTVIPNHNDLLDRFPGADGMKTGFICASGFNVVASAQRGGRRLIAVVLGARNARVRAEKAAELFTKGFAGESMTGLFSRTQNVAAMDPTPEISNAPVNMREQICGKKRNVGEDAASLDATPAQEGDNGAVIPPGGAQAGKKITYLSPKFNTAPTLAIYIGGADIGPARIDELPEVPKPVKVAKPPKGAAAKAVATAPAPAVKAAAGAKAAASAPAPAAKAVPVAAKPAPGSIVPQAVAKPAGDNSVKQTFDLFSSPGGARQASAGPAPAGDTKPKVVTPPAKAPPVVDPKKKKVD